MEIIRRATSALVLVLVATGVVALVGSPASSASTGQAAVSADSGVLYKGCVQHAINYSVSPPPASSSWMLTVTVLGPDDATFSEFLVLSSQPPVGSRPQAFCSTHLAGAYTINASLEVTELVDGKFQKTVTPVPAATFVMRRPRLKVVSTVRDKSPRVGSSVKVMVKVSDERPSGDFFPTPLATVRVWRQARGKWVVVAGASGDTDAKGKVRLKFSHKWAGRTRFKVVAASSAISANRSVTFALKGHR